MKYITTLSITILIFFTNHNAKSDTYWQFSEKCMGTDFHILIDNENGKISKEAAEEAFIECERLNHIFSDYIADSEASKLSKSAYADKSVRVSIELFDLLNYSQTLAKKTHGAFDPTLGQLTRLWRISRFRQSLPTKASLLNARRKKGYQYIELNNTSREVKIAYPGLILDFGGVAKGYAADKMMLKLRENGINRCLIDAGGDITIGDPPRNKKGWRIEIGGNKHPDLPTLVLHNCSVATSGDTEQFVKIGSNRYSHILDPFTGYGLQNLSQVTVIAPEGVIADSIATAALVLGPVMTKKILIQDKQTRAFFVTKKEKNTNLTIVSR
jgi:thiamine biosynthesis lipoprotein